MVHAFFRIRPAVPASRPSDSPAPVALRRRPGAGILASFAALGFMLSGCLPGDFVGPSQPEKPAAKSVGTAPAAEPECVLLWDEATQSRRLDCPDPTPPPLFLD